MIRVIFTLIVLLVANVACCQDYYFKPDSSAVFDKSLGKEFFKQCSRYVPENITGFYNIDSLEIKILERNFLKIFLLPPRALRNNKNVFFLQKYGCQYIGVIINHEKYIYINTFAVYEKSEWEHRFGGWRSGPIKICDGGDDYFGVLFSIKDKTFSQLEFNGFG